ncbi:MAG: hypothetical protein ABR878_13465 [Roseiarcus sp.]|jgi:hypothetical protein
MNYQQISDVNIDRFAVLSDRINKAIEIANEAVLEAHAAIKSAQMQIILSRLALEAKADTQAHWNPV